MTSRRSKISGHWYVKASHGLLVEAYRARRNDWDLCDIYTQKVEATDTLRSLLEYEQLDHRHNIVYPKFRGEFVPSFASLRAMLKWVKHVQTKSNRKEIA